MSGSGLSCSDSEVLSYHYSFFKKKLINLEPIGSVKPKLTSGDKSRTEDITISSAHALLCPAQSFPISLFR